MITTEELAHIRAIAEADKEGADGKAWDEAITPDTVIALCRELELARKHAVTMSEVAAAALWNALPRAMTWTTEQPKVPGWYWFRNGNAKPMILSITLPVKWKAEPDDEWAGPIPEPREPKE